jgi:hypothetical protein
MSRREAFDAGTSGLVDRMVSQAKDKLAEEQARDEGRDGRGKPGHAGQVGRDASGQYKTTIRPSAEGQELLRRLAAEQHLTQDDVVELGLRVLAVVLAAGRLDVHAMTYIKYNDKRPWLSTTRIDWARFRGDFLP